MTDHPDLPERLRRALAARAEEIEPAPGALDRIEEQLMTRSARTDVPRWILAATAAVAAVVVVVALVAGDDDDERQVAADASTSTTEAGSSTTPSTTSTTTVPSTTTTTTFSPPVDPFAVAFPAPDASRSFEDPEPAARAYATDVLGFTELVVGTAGATGDATAAVVVSDRDGGPETTIDLLRSDDGAWFVVGSTTPDVVVRDPAPGGSVASPFPTSGEALAFEGTVEVVVLAQDGTVLGSGIVTGSGSPPAGPFEGSIAFDPPVQPTPGIVLYRIHSPEDGRVVQATSVRVRLAP